MWCTGLKEIVIPNNVTYYGDYMFVKCTGLKRVVLSNGNGGHVPNIRAGMFTQCDNLEEIEIPEGVTTIAEYAFTLCPKLNVKLPSTLTTIGGKAFAGCNAMTSLNFGPDMKYVGYQAFYSCPGLKTISCESAVPPTLDGPCFDTEAYTSVALTVPESSVDAYKNATEWKEFTDINGSGAVGSIATDSPFSISGREIALHDANSYVEVYTPAGNAIYRGQCSGTVTLPEAGIYIIRIDGKAVKAYVK